MAVKTYSYSKDKDYRLSDHFQVWEFASISDSGYIYSDNVLIDSNLIAILEDVYSHFSCSRIDISSGYRTPQHDRDVGGSGSGYHTLGRAADFCAYDSKGNPINSRIISCYLQDKGVKGIGLYCGGAQNYTHADTRTNYTWYGDERDYSDGYSNYYSYTNTKRYEVYPNENSSSSSNQSSGGSSNMSMEGKKGVDISYSNGDIDLSKVKSAGFDFVMIRCGYGSDISSQDDSQFASNVAKAEKLGMPWGAYLFSYACSTSDAQSELAHIDRLLKAEKAKGHIPSMPIALDIEPSNWVSNHGGWNKTNLTNVATIVLDGLTKLGYYPMIYTGYDELDNMLSDHIRNDYDCWFAQWNSTPNTYKYNRMGIWQYGGETNYLESNSISGVGTIDKNKCYKDYPTIIKNGGYNGFSKGSSSNTSGSGVTTVLKSNEAIAQEVIDGKWGSGDERKKLLTQAGYNYAAVQNIVNEMFANGTAKSPNSNSSTTKVLDTTGYKRDCDPTTGSLALKELLLIARQMKIITQGVDENGYFGDGTYLAVNQVLKIGGYKQNGIAGDNFVKYLAKLIRSKIK